MYPSRRCRDVSRHSGLMPGGMNTQVAEDVHMWRRTRRLVAELALCSCGQLTSLTRPDAKQSMPHLNVPPPGKSTSRGCVGEVIRSSRPGVGGEYSGAGCRY
ncbi:hypothetical protein BD311DRAFT_745209 [Dichomitus squalens]|uniref:Uncharacterized protein n=1 Tax=Dichomitus squalens TaxID=114155 RepID=A0A4Q9N3Z6_9APHY|nr:hypothetical protein BD311DRAFT_745209 [Dichomitus squalens]